MTGPSLRLPDSLRREMLYSGWAYDLEMGRMWGDLVTAYSPLMEGIPLEWELAEPHQAARYRREDGVWKVGLSPLLFSRYPIFLARYYRLPMGLPPLHAMVHILQREGRVIPLNLEKAFGLLATRAAHPAVRVVAYYGSAPEEPLPLLVEMAVGNPQVFASWVAALEEVYERGIGEYISGHHAFGPLFAWALEEGKDGAPLPLQEKGEPIKAPPLQTYRPLFGPPHYAAVEEDPTWRTLYAPFMWDAEATANWKDYWYFRVKGGDS